MPHDRHNNPLNVGDTVALLGTITSIDSEQPHYCNITMKTEVGMAPEQPDHSLALSARMVDLYHQAKSRGQLAYEAYQRAKHSTSTFSEQDRFCWKELDPEQHIVWEAAAEAARLSVFPIIITSTPKPTA